MYLHTYVHMYMCTYLHAYIRTYVRTYLCRFQVVCNIDGGDVVKSDSPVPSVVNSNVFTEFVSQLALPDDQKKVCTY